MRDRLLGMGIGGAIGDALGAQVEFMARGTFPPVTGYRAGGPHRLAEGQWTDDTSMALALADSLRSGFHLNDQMDRYLSWYRDGKYSVNGRCFDIGTQTRAALSAFERNGSVDCLVDVDENACGNGSIMRLAPIVARYGREPRIRLAELAHLSSAPTHPAKRCRDACAYLALLLKRLVAGEGRDVAFEEVLLDFLACVPNPDAQVNRVARGEFRDGLRATGYVIDTLECAVRCFLEAETFEQAVLSAANLGDDADTVACVTGYLAGAHFGHSGIPMTLLSDLAQGGMIYDAYDALIQTAVPS